MTPSAPIHYLSVLNVESLTFKKYRLHYTVLSYGLYNEGVEKKKRRFFRYIEEDKQGNAGEYYVRTWDKQVTIRFFMVTYPSVPRSRLPAGVKTK